MVFVSTVDLPTYLETRFRSQQEAAEMLNVSQGAISHWSRGRRTPSASKALEIVATSKRGCAITLNDIYGSAERRHAA
jgi:transcriptional regulator with XRE-family HTH domain